MALSLEVLRTLARDEPVAAWTALVDQALWSFASTSEGQAYFSQNKLDGYRKLRPRELEIMEPFAAETRQVLMGK